MFQTPLPLSLYIHIPWCIRKCPYCDFNSHESQNIPEKAYIHALLADLEQDLSRIEPRQIISIFMGGGTPSLFSPQAIDSLLMEIRARLQILPHAEITLEANPGSVDRSRLKDFYQLGINRLSLGIQSFDQLVLQHLGRIHNRQEALRAIEDARMVGFDNLNLDLMFGSPFQTLASALEDLQIATIFQPTHLSYYQLTIEPHTVFGHHPPVLPEEDFIADMQVQGEEYLLRQAYLHYEISAYAQAQRQCQHNLNYWQFGDYLGIGAGAHGKLTNRALGTLTRLSKQRHPLTYLHQAHTPLVVASHKILQAEEVCLEFMMNSLRLYAGFQIDQFTNSTGLALEVLAFPLQQAYAKHWLIREGDRICATPLGMRFLNEVLELFIS